MICEHCNHEQKDSGYDDAFYHQNIIPNIECNSCGKAASDDYQPNQTKYSEGMTV